MVAVPHRRDVAAALRIASEKPRSLDVTRKKKGVLSPALAEHGRVSMPMPRRRAVVVALRFAAEKPQTMGVTREAKALLDAVLAGSHSMAVLLPHAAIALRFVLGQP